MAAVRVKRECKVPKRYIEEFCNEFSSKSKKKGAKDNNLYEVVIKDVDKEHNRVKTHFVGFEHVFEFEQPFQIHENMEVLMRMGLAFGLEKTMCSDQNLEIAKTMVSKELEPYLVEMAKTGKITMTKEQQEAFVKLI